MPRLPHQADGPARMAARRLLPAARRALGARPRDGARPPIAALLGATGLEPASRSFGFERGRPIDRWYIERFLAAHRDDVRGRVLEVAEDSYTRAYGDGAVTRSDVLYAAAEGAPPEATVIGDLTTGAGLEGLEVDCFVLTQTLHLVWDVAAAVRGARDVLAPGGVLLCTVPGISQTSRLDRERWGDFWRFTQGSAERLFGEAFGADAVQVASHGNVFSAAAFLYGYAAEDLTEAQLAHRDTDFDLLLTVRAVRRRAVC